jgi:nucleoside-diphosphate-sugar epimerase
MSAPVLQANDEAYLINRSDRILVTGAAGFIGSRLVAALMDRGFRNVRCLVRSARKAATLQAKMDSRVDGARPEMVHGNLLAPADCLAVTKDVAVIFHLAAGRGEKSFPDAFANSVVTTRNLLEASRRHGGLRRFVNVSSFAVYSNEGSLRGGTVDETCPIHAHPERLGDAYSFAKVKQDEIVREYGDTFGVPYVIVRPGWVYGPGNEAMTGRVGLNFGGLFLHLGGSNTIPLAYVDNCAEAIMLAGLTPGVDGQTFNVVDDDLRSSRELLSLYKRNVRRIRSVYVPRAVSYALCSLWERYSRWSEGQLPNAYNRVLWRGYWKKVRYSNEKLKTRLGWTQKVPTDVGLTRYFDACRAKGRHA